VGEVRGLTRAKAALCAGTWSWSRVLARPMLEGRDVGLRSGTMCVCVCGDV